MGKEKKKKYVDETSMTDFTKTQLKKQKMGVRKSNNKKNDFYRRNKVVYQGYSCLENIGIVRKYIQRYYDIDFSILETLIYLFPKGYFTLMDYYNLDKQFHIASVKRLKELGYAKMASKGSRYNGKALYTLTYKSQKIVENFYETLFGDRPFDMIKVEKMFDETKLGDGKTVGIIKKLDKSFHEKQKK